MQEKIEPDEEIRQQKGFNIKFHGGKNISKKLSEKKFKKKLRRKRKKLNGIIRLAPSNYQLKQLSIKSYSSFIRFLNKIIEKDEKPSKTITVPTKLSFVLNFEEAIFFLKIFIIRFIEQTKV